MFALIDGNNFYVSCERAFNPRLQEAAVVVLSNNDGCVISRSEEAKARGIQMAQPFYQIQNQPSLADVVVCSANFTLYGDMSARLMRLASALGPSQEVYSIDECFIGDLQGIPHITARARTIRSRIERCLGIPCGIGLGPTKTLAKLCNHVAKQAERGSALYPAQWAQVCNWQEMDLAAQQTLLRQTPVRQVWGVGSKMALRLATHECTNAWDLAHLPPAQARKLGGVVLERTVYELRGMSCLSLEEAAPVKQQIACTRSFGTAIETLEPLLEAVSEFASRAAYKARQAQLRAHQLHVFAYTSPFRSDAPWHGAATVPLPCPSNDTRTLVATAQAAMVQLYQAPHRLSKAGVILLGLAPEQSAQVPDLFAPDTDTPKLAAADLMHALDTINARYGRGTIQLASSGLPGRDAAGWRMKQTMRSPIYTVRYEDLPVARA